MGERDGLSAIDAIRVFWNWLAQRDELPKIEANPERTHRYSSFMIWLIAPETLPQEPSARSKPRRGLSWLFSSGSLPNPPQRGATESRSFLFWLLQPEKLPASPTDPASKEAS